MTVVVEIGGCTICLRTTDVRLLEALRCQYRAFLSSNDHDSLVIDIHPRRDFRHPNPDGSDDFFNEQRFHDGRCEVVSNYFSGWVDGRRNHAELEIDAANPLAWFEHFLRVAFAVHAIRHNAVLFHGAGLVHAANGYILFGPSGAGKSTVASLSPRCAILGDDMVVIKRTGGQFHVLASPFNGNRHGFRFSNTGAPLVGLYRLIQDKISFLRPMTAGTAMADLLANMPTVNRNPDFTGTAMNFCSDLLNQVPCAALHFTKDNTFWRCIDEHTQRLRQTQQRNRLPRRGRRSGGGAAHAKRHQHLE